MDTGDGPPRTEDAREDEGNELHIQGSGISRVFKRLRKTFNFNRSAKAAKKSPSAAPGNVEGSRDLLTSTPAQSTRGRHSTPPRPTSADPTSSFRSKTPPQDPRPSTSPRVQLPESLSTSALPLPQSFSLPERPGLPQSAASEGNLITCPDPNLIDQILHSTSSPTSPLSPSASSSSPPSPTSSTSAIPNAIPQSAFPLHAERAEALFNKYGVPLEPEGFFYNLRPRQGGVSNAERVHKPVRIRLHHHCHRCGLAIGKNGVCIQCGHKRCRKCGQWPDKDKRRSAGNGSRSTCSGSSKGKGRTVPEAALRRETLDHWLSKAPRASTSNSRTLSSFFITPRARTIRTVRRLCHECHAPFIWTETRCQDCEHEICDECPQDPPPDFMDLCAHAEAEGHYHNEDEDQHRSHSLPPSRDRVLKKPRLRVRYNCDACGTTFEDARWRCKGCGHQRCENCPRFPPRGIPQPQPSSETLAALNRRLASFS